MKQGSGVGSSSTQKDVPALTCLSGIPRGKIFRLEDEQTYHLRMDPAKGAVINEDAGESGADETLAHFHPFEGGFECGTEPGKRQHTRRFDHQNMSKTVPIQRVFFTIYRSGIVAYHFYPGRASFTSSPSNMDPNLSRPLHSLDL